jgi:adenylate cyclase
VSLIEELKRRNVFRVGLAYAVAAWLLLQVTDIVTPILQLPESIPKTVLFLLVIGFILAVILAWAFELTPEGVKLESEVDRSKSISSQTGRKLDRAIIVVFAIAIGFLLVDKFVLQSTPESGTPANSGMQQDSSATGRVAESNKDSPENQSLPVKIQRSVAVLPFVTMSNGPDDDYFSDGLTEEIINALAQLPELLVTARTSAFHFKGRNIPVEEIAGQLGVAHIVEGSVRRAGEQLRITAQLIRAEDGFHLWSETYDRRTEDTFAVQADIAEKVAAALDIFLDENRRARMRRAGIRNVEAYTAYQKGLEPYELAHSEGEQISRLRQANEQFDLAISLAPDFSDAYIRHSDLFSHILMTQANGQLDGNITDEDLANAPAALRHDLKQAVSHAKTPGQRMVSEFDRALLLGEWRGLASISERALTAPGCEVAFWGQNASAPFGKAQMLRNALSRLAACDPVAVRPWVHIVMADLWLGQPEHAIEMAESAMQTVDHNMLTSAYITALAMVDRFEQARRVANIRLRTESEQLKAKFQLAAMQGDAAAASTYQEKFLGPYGPDDYMALIMEARRGRRNEANRLAGLIDRRPFGYMTLMLAIYQCTCGAPFDLEAAPVFASMLAESGLPWPPAKPINFPLKNW